MSVASEKIELADIPNRVPAKNLEMLSVEVVAGTHLGACTKIDFAPCTIGSRLGSDLVLLDAGVAAEHVQLRFYGRYVAIAAIGGDVHLDGVAVVAKGFGKRTTLPVTIGIGDASLRITRHRDRYISRRRMIGVAAILAIAFIVVPITAASTSSFSSQATKPAGSGGPLNVQAISTVSPRPGPGEVTSELLAEIERVKLSDVHLATNGNRIVASGQIARSQTGDWREIQQWFDSKYGVQYLLSNEVSVSALTTAPKIVFQAVYFGVNPYVVDMKGERRYPGSALQDGWHLKAIQNGKISVAKGEQEFVLTL